MARASSSLPPPKKSRRACARATALPPPLEEGTRDKIKAAAIRQFAQHGFRGATTKAICEEAQANIAALHYHFHSKEALYLEILHDFTRQFPASALRILQTPENQQALRIRLDLFMHEILALFLNHIGLFRIAQRDIDEGNPLSEEVFCQSFGLMFSSLITFMRGAIEARLLDERLDAGMLADTFFHMIIAEIKQEERRERIRTHATPVSVWTEEERTWLQRTLADPVYRKQFVEHSLYIFLNGAFPR